MQNKSNLTLRFKIEICFLKEIFHSQLLVNYFSFQMVQPNIEKKSIEGHENKIECGEIHPLHYLELKINSMLYRQVCRFNSALQQTKSCKERKNI